MAAPILTQIPSEIRAGTTVEYTRTLSDYPANAGWTMALAIRGASVLDKAATASGANHKIELTAAETAGLTPGNYQFIERVTETATSKKYDATVGQLIALRNLSTAIAGDALTWEEKTLAVVEAALSGRATSDMQAYSIAGRSVSKIPIQELRAWREWLRWAVAKQRNPGGFSKDVLVTFPSTMRP